MMGAAEGDDPAAAASSRVAAMGDGRSSPWMAAIASSAIARTALCGASPRNSSGGPECVAHARTRPLRRDMRRANRPSAARAAQRYLMARSALSFTTGERCSHRRARCSAQSSSASGGIARMDATSSSRRYAGGGTRGFLGGGEGGRRGAVRTDAVGIRRGRGLFVVRASDLGFGPTNAPGAVLSSSVHTASSLRRRTNASELAASSEAPWAAKLRRSDTKPDIAALVGRGARAGE